MNEELFAELETSIKEMGAILRGEQQPSRVFVIESPDVKAIRAGYQLSQIEFATLLGISVKTLRNWEQGRRTPEGPARVLASGRGQASRCGLGRDSSGAGDTRSGKNHIESRSRNGHDR